MLATHTSINRGVNGEQIPAGILKPEFILMMKNNGSNSNYFIHPPLVERFYFFNSTLKSQIKSVTSQRGGRFIS
ncbi:MAG: hypothetical protein Q8N83_15890 [Ignavibacteria bacterium]|nr:hypothetical protein [Ignavibacteria bacterium]